jgi:hypothetical protein
LPQMHIQLVHCDTKVIDLIWNRVPLEVSRLLHAMNILDHYPYYIQPVSYTIIIVPIRYSSFVKYAVPTSLLIAPGLRTFSSCFCLAMHDGNFSVYVLGLHSHFELLLFSHA